MLRALSLIKQSKTTEQKVMSIHVFHTVPSPKALHQGNKITDKLMECVFENGTEQDTAKPILTKTFSTTTSTTSAYMPDKYIVDYKVVR